MDILISSLLVILVPATLLTLGMGLVIGSIATRLAKYRASL
ncbi:hypothetical protein [Gluconobacter oxydans]